jgi:fused signal recognition particle receptor
MVGVNGVGKTTTLAKIAHRKKQQGKSVMLAACDTFRAAAIEQLQSWAQQLDLPVISQSHGADAAAVAFDAYNAARARNMDYLLIDSAGRQHTHSDLMEQLQKIKRVLAKVDQSAPHEVLLTVDAGNGQNVISQVEHFHSKVPLTGICVAKLDGTAKGGIVISLAQRFQLPIRYVGVGEGIDDLGPFDAVDFVDALLPDLSEQ